MNTKCRFSRKVFSWYLFKVSALSLASGVVWGLELVANSNFSTAIWNNTLGHFRLSEDVNLTQSEDGIPRSPWQPVEFFNGTLDGDGHAIYGLKINETNRDTNSGLFRRLNGEVRDLTFVDPQVFASGDGVYLGLVAGENSGNVTGVVWQGGWMEHRGTWTTSIENDRYPVLGVIGHNLPGGQVEAVALSVSQTGKEEMAYIGIGAGVNAGSVRGMALSVNQAGGSAAFIGIGGGHNSGNSTAQVLAMNVNQIGGACSNIGIGSGYNGDNSTVRGLAFNVNQTGEGNNNDIGIGAGFNYGIAQSLALNVNQTAEGRNNSIAIGAGFSFGIAQGLALNVTQKGGNYTDIGIGAGYNALVGIAQGLALNVNQAGEGGSDIGIGAGFNAVHKGLSGIAQGRELKEADRAASLRDLGLTNRQGDWVNNPTQYPMLEGLDGGYQDIQRLSSEFNQATRDFTPPSNRTDASWFGSSIWKSLERLGVVSVSTLPPTSPVAATTTVLLPSADSMNTTASVLASPSASPVVATTTVQLPPEDSMSALGSAFAPSSASPVVATTTVLLPPEDLMSTTASALVSPSASPVVATTTVLLPPEDLMSTTASALVSPSASPVVVTTVLLPPEDSMSTTASALVSPSASPVVVTTVLLPPEDSMSTTASALVSPSASRVAATTTVQLPSEDLMTTATSVPALSSTTSVATTTALMTSASAMSATTAMTMPAPSSTPICPAPVGTPVFQTYDPESHRVYVVIRSDSEPLKLVLAGYRGTALDRQFGQCGKVVYNASDDLPDDINGYAGLLRQDSTGTHIYLFAADQTRSLLLFDLPLSEADDDQPQFSVHKDETGLNPQVRAVLSHAGQSYVTGKAGDPSRVLVGRYQAQELAEFTDEGQQNSNEQGNALSLSPDSTHLYVAGVRDGEDTFSVFLRRYDRSSLTLDATFGTSGEQSVIHTDDYESQQAVAVYRGRVYVATTSARGDQLSIRRYDPENGVMDGAFVVDEMFSDALVTASEKTARVVLFSSSHYLHLLKYDHEGHIFAATYDDRQERHRTVKNLDFPTVASTGLAVTDGKVYLAFERSGNRGAIEMVEVETPLLKVSTGQSGAGDSGGTPVWAYVVACSAAVVTAVTATTLVIICRYVLSKHRKSVTAPQLIIMKDIPDAI